MPFSSARLVVALTFILTPILGAPTTPLIAVETYSGTTKPNSYIVTLKDNVSKSDHLDWLSQQVGTDGVTHPEWQSDFLNGFAGEFSSDTLDLLRSNTDVQSIAEDGIVTIDTLVTQNDAPWGIARLSQDAILVDQNTSDLNYTYKYDSSAGAGVDIYVIDTGIFTNHSQFGGRARWGATFGGYPDADGNGHGTHVSGTAAGSQYGVAKSANLIAVKVLDDTGSGSVSNIISGLNFVMTSVQASGRPSIATMSLGGGGSTPFDDAVTSLTNAGIHVTVAAGNANVDAANISPARVPSANTIGATTIADVKATFSNFGAVVDLWAPGQNIISAWIGNLTATNNISGTSMSTPHVAGLIAYLIGRNGNLSPADMSNQLQNISLKGVITGIPNGTINDFARNDE